MAASAAYRPGTSVASWTAALASLPQCALAPTCSMRTPRTPCRSRCTLGQGCQCCCRTLGQGCQCSVKHDRERSASGSYMVHLFQDPTSVLKHEPAGVSRKSLEALFWIRVGVPSSLHLEETATFTCETKLGEADS